MQYINSKAVKELALYSITALRPAWGANRISKEFLARIDAKVRAMVIEEIRRQPSMGKTLK